MVCQNMNQLLVRLLTLSEVEDLTSSSRLKEKVLRLLLELVSSNGAIEMKHGPMDAQCTLLEFLLKLNYESVDSNLLKNLIESVSKIVFWNFQATQNVESRKSSHDLSGSGSAGKCFGNLFSSVLGAEPPVSKRANKNALECNLLNLATKLVISTTVGFLMSFFMLSSHAFFILKGFKHNEATRDGLASKSDEEKQSSKIEAPIKATSQIDSSNNNVKFICWLFYK